MRVRALASALVSALESVLPMVQSLAQVSAIPSVRRWATVWVHDSELGSALSSVLP